MTIDQLIKVLQLGQVNAGNDTLFVQKDKMPVDREHLTLVISTGGSGAAAIREAIQLANERLVDDYTKYMKFIMVDSALNEMRKENDKVNDKIIPIAISSNGAKDRLARDKRSPFYRSFMPEAYHLELINPDGTAQNRMTGKIKFYDLDTDPSVNTYNDVKLRREIEKLYQGDWAALKDKSVDIMILTGLAGGNGSGTFMDIAAHAQYACKQYTGGTVRLFGYMFLPDTMEDYVTPGTDLRPMCVNGYAALKELESYMSIPFNPDRTEVFASQEPGIRFEIKKLFDYPILISGKHNETVSMIAENILNMAIQYESAVDAQGNHIVFDQNSFYSNTLTTRNHFFLEKSANGLLNNDEFLEDSRLYAGIGYAHAGIPDEIVTANIVGHVTRNVFSTQTTPQGNVVGFCTSQERDWLSKDVMKSCIRTMVGLDDTGVDLSERSLWEEKIQPMLELSMSSSNDNITNAKQVRMNNIANYHEGFGITRTIEEKTKEIREALLLWMTQFRENTAQVMEQYGPRAIQFLYDGIGPADEDGNVKIYEFGIRKMLLYVRRMMRELSFSKAQYPSNDISNGWGEAFFKKALQQWKLDYTNAVLDEVQFSVWANISEKGGAWEQLVQNELDVYMAQIGDFAERLELLEEDYWSHGSCLDLDDVAIFLEASKILNCVNLCDNERVYQWVKRTVRLKINGIDTGMVRQSLVESFQRYPDRWSSQSDGVTRAEFDRVMSECCELGKGAKAGKSIGLSTQNYFSYLVEGFDPDNDVAKIHAVLKDSVSHIASQLLIKSAPKMNLRDGVAASINTFVIIPQDLVKGFVHGATIKNCFQEYLGGTIAISPSVKDIVCYQTSVANALSDLKDLHQWEVLYHRRNPYDRTTPVHLSMGEFRYGGDYVERTKEEIDKDKALLAGEAYQPQGLSKEEDIIFGTGLSWQHYPEIDLQHLAENRSEKDFMQTMFHPIVNYACRKGLIERKGDNEHHNYVLHLLPEHWTNLDMSEYQETDPDTGLYLRGQSLFDYVANRNGESQSNPVDIRLIGAGIFGSGFDFSEVKNSKTPEQIERISDEYMRRILRKNTKLFLDLRKTLNRYYEIEKQLEEKETVLIHKNKARMFVEYYKYGTVGESVNEDEECIWYYLDEKRRRHNFSSHFSEVWASGLYTSDQQIRKALYEGGWLFVLAFEEYANKLNLDELNVVHQMMLSDPAKAKQMKTERSFVLEDWRRKIDQLLENQGDLLIQDAIALKLFAKRYRELPEREKYYVDTLRYLYSYLPKAMPAMRPLSAPQIVPAQVSGKTWKCPTCGKQWDEKFMICPMDRTERPAAKTAKTWNCPKCGREWDSEFEICPIDRTERPNAKTAKTWICPKCGREWDSEFQICPIDGTEHFSESRPKTWTCPTCANRWDEEFIICPKDRTPRPW